MNKQTDLSNSLSFTKCLPQIPSGAVSNITKPTSTCDSPGPLSASSHQVCANSQRGATLQGLCTLPGSPTSPVTRVVQARLNLDDDVLLDWAEDTITAICERNTFRKWLLVRGFPLTPPETGLGSRGAALEAASQWGPNLARGTAVADDGGSLLVHIWVYIYMCIYTYIHTYIQARTGTALLETIKNDFGVRLETIH